MQFQHYDLGQMHTGEVVEIILEGNAANVLLLDSANLNNFKQRRSYRYLGGQQVRSPGYLRVPNAGHWHIVIHLGGYAGTVRSSVRKVN